MVWPPARGRWRSPIHTAGLSLTLPILPLAPPLDDPRPLELAAPQAADLEAARALSDAGQRAFELGHYDEAIARWEHAYMLLPADEAALLEATLLYKITLAHQQAYTLDGDRRHLELALRLLDRYRTHVRADDEESLADSDERRATLLRLLEEQDAAEQDAAEQDAAEQDAACEPATAASEAADQGDQPDALAHAPGEPPPPRLDAEAQARRRYRLEVSLGASATALGAAATWGLALTSALGADINRQMSLTSDYETLASLDRRGRTYNRTAVASGVLAGALLATGVALLVDARRHRPAPLAKQAPTLGLGPGALEVRF
ncbi:hypothetical protein G6O69_11210 [Pseudenhygromyxa sp. WMMC2535]|uniref:hypothetical protein n=1 Tax=Pseudenhygromyxa sp. WMMC2535 TaxID=2712867 RepID=UPI00155480B5|nr:hypothetical protein [Pseudenhygromyxa sp. WMMC2535]NVB38400.1 hypothetical protein [Pseudenhygromyxa sp. WMMC2535]